MAEGEYEETITAKLRLSPVSVNSLDAGNRMRASIRLHGRANRTLQGDSEELYPAFRHGAEPRPAERTDKYGGPCP